MTLLYILVCSLTLPRCFYFRCFTGPVPSISATLTHYSQEPNSESQAPVDAPAVASPPDAASLEKLCLLTEQLEQMQHEAQALQAAHRQQGQQLLQAQQQVEGLQVQLEQAQALSQVPSGSELLPPLIQQQKQQQGISGMDMMHEQLARAQAWASELHGQVQMLTAGLPGTDKEAASEGAGNAAAPTLSEAPEAASMMQQVSELQEQVRDTQSQLSRAQLWAAELYAELQQRPGPPQAVFAALPCDDAGLEYASAPLTGVRGLALIDLSLCSCR